MRGRATMAAALAAAFLSLGVAAGGPHVLSARGTHGWIRYSGEGKVTLSGRGTLVVKNESNLQITLDGTWGHKEKVADGAIYTQFKGTLHSIGPGAHLEIRGWDLALDVKGRGKAWFQGHGTVVLDGAPAQAWPEDQTHNGWLKLKFRN